MDNIADMLNSVLIYTIIFIPFIVCDFYYTIYDSSCTYRSKSNFLTFPNVLMASGICSTIMLLSMIIIEVVEKQYLKISKIIAFFANLAYLITLIFITVAFNNVNTCENASFKNYYIVASLIIKYLFEGLLVLYFVSYYADICCFRRCVTETRYDFSDKNNVRYNAFDDEIDCDLIKVNNQSSYKSIYPTNNEKSFAPISPHMTDDDIIVRSI